MSITTQTKIYLAIAVAVLAIILGNSMWARYQTARLERQVWDAHQRAEAATREARQKEIEAAEYKKKIEYLESQLSDIRVLAKKQDEELEKLNINSRDARVRLGRARRARPTAVTDAELCAKLAELGYQVRTPCVNGGNER